MKPKLLLASAPVTLKERYGSFTSAASTEPSFALPCLAAVAKQADIEVAILDASAMDLTVETAFERVKEFDPDVLGITSTTLGITAAGSLARKLKELRPSSLTIVGGCHASALPEETLNSFEGFDLAAIGEGEEILRDILDRVANGDTLPTDVAGTASQSPDGPKVNPRRELIKELDSLPLPAWELIEGFPNAFHPSPARIMRAPCASIVLTRGCPNQCTFCDRSVFGNRCRAYSPAYAIEMLKVLRTDYGVKEVLIEDDTFIIAKQRVKEFCERMISERIDMTWSCLGRADRVDLDLLKLMRRAGCWHISYGIESGDPDILKAVNKNLDLGQVRQALRWSRQAGLRTKGFFMVGFPGETRASLAKTRSIAESLPLDDITVMQLTPFPGSEIYGHAQTLGSFERDWKRMNTLNTVFVPNGLTRDDLETARSTILRSFYLRFSVITRQLLHMLAHPRLIPHMLRGFSAFMKTTAGTSQ